MAKIKSQKRKSSKGTPAATSGKQTNLMEKLFASAFWEQDSVDVTELTNRGPAVGGVQPIIDQQLEKMGVKVEAATRDEDGRNHGLLFTITDQYNVRHPLHVHRSDLEMSEKKFIATLVGLGASIGGGKKSSEILKVLVKNARPDRRVVMTGKTGWVQGRYVTPTQTIGEAVRQKNMDEDETVVFNPTFRCETPIVAKGTHESWVNSVSKLCEGNPHLVFAISAAFASALLGPLGEEGGGFNFVGPSSTGKSTALVVANSVWGPEGRIKGWRTTANALENTARQFNDALLCLDEIGTLDPRLAGDAAYQLANGAGKSRLRPDGTGQPTSSWRLMFLSSGEVGIAGLIAEGGRIARQGQLLRLADIPVERNDDKGIIYDLHGRGSSEVLVRELKTASRENCGAPIISFLERITKMQQGELREKAGNLVVSFEAEANKLRLKSAQSERVARRFALVSAAGTLATKLGITGWHKKEAENAALHLFGKWLETQPGTEGGEAKAIVDRVMDYFLRYGDKHYAEVDPSESSHGFLKRGRCGFRYRYPDREEYRIYPVAFKSLLCKGFEQNLVCEVLAKRGLLVLDPEGSSTCSHRDPSTKRTARFYVIRDPIGDGSEESKQARPEVTKKRNGSKSLTA